MMKIEIDFMLVRKMGLAERALARTSILTLIAMPMVAAVSHLVGASHLAVVAEDAIAVAASISVSTWLAVTR